MTMGPPPPRRRSGRRLPSAPTAASISPTASSRSPTSLGTSRTLALAIQKEGADLVLCGRKTLDSETWQVPPEVAAFLGLAAGDERRLARGERRNAAGQTPRRRRRGDLRGHASCSLLGRVASGRRWTSTRIRSPKPTAGSSSGRLPTSCPTCSRTTSASGRRARRPASSQCETSRPSALERPSPIPRQAAARVKSLLAERPVTPSAWEKPERLGEKPGESYDCWSVVELVDGRPARVSLELLAKGRELAGKLGGSNVALVLGHGLEEAAAEAARHGAERGRDRRRSAPGRVRARGLGRRASPGARTRATACAADPGHAAAGATTARAPRERSSSG